MAFWQFGGSGGEDGRESEDEGRGSGCSTLPVRVRILHQSTSPTSPTVLPYCHTTTHTTPHLHYRLLSMVGFGEGMFVRPFIHSLHSLYPPPGSTKQVLAAWPALRWGPTIQADLLPRICGGAWAPHGACPQTWHSWCPARLSLTFPSFFCQSRCSVGTKVPVLSQTGTGAC